MKRQGVEKKREGNKTRTPPSSHRERRERRRLKLQGCQARANAKQSHNCRPAPNPQQQSQPLRRISKNSAVSRHFFFFLRSAPSLCISSCSSEVDDSEISIFSAFIGPDSYQRLSSFLIGFSRLRSDAALHSSEGFISTSLSSLANTRRGRFDARRRLSHVLASCRQVSGVTRYARKNPCSGRLFNFNFSTHVPQCPSNSPPQRRRSRMQRFGFTPSGSSGR